MRKRVFAAVLCLVMLCAGAAMGDTCKHEHTILTQGGHYYPYSTTLHVIYDDYFTYCLDCGTVLDSSVWMDGYYEPHTFNSEGVCTACGYKEGTTPSTTIIKGNEPIEVDGEILTPQRVTMNNPAISVRRASYAGPGDQYESTGGFELYKISAVYAWMIDGDYVLVDMHYRTLKRCTVYIHRKYFDASSLRNVPEIELTSIGSAKLNKTVTPAMFPASDRRMFNASDAKLEKGASVPVFMERGGYLFCQFKCKDGKEARGWIPVDATDWIK